MVRQVHRRHWPTLNVQRIENYEIAAVRCASVDDREDPALAFLGIGAAQHEDLLRHRLRGPSGVVKCKSDRVLLV